MPDEPMAEQSPLITREQPHEVLLDFCRVAVLRETKSSGNACHVSIDDYSFVNAKGIAQDNIRRLAADSRKRGQGVE